MIFGTPTPGAGDSRPGVLLRLRRITTGGDYLPAVDGVRFLAIVLVLLQHIGERVTRRAVTYYPDAESRAVWWILGQGNLGVQLFFALSGFILYRGLCRVCVQGDDWGAKYRSYLWRRITRLEPPYLLVTTGIFLFLVTTGYQSQFSRSANIGDQSLGESYAASLLYLHGIRYESFPRLNPPTWSLETEFQFYLIAPGLAWPIRRIINSKWGRIAMLGMLLAVLATTVTPEAAAYTRARYTILVYAPLFVSGFVACELYDSMKSWRFAGGTRRWMPDLLAVLSALYLSSASYLGAGAAGSIEYCLGLIGLLLGATCGSILSRLFGMGFVSALGGMCYSIYLVHLPVMDFTANLVKGIGSWLPFFAYLGLQGLMLVAATMVISTSFYLLVEQPCMDRNWPARLWQSVYQAGRKIGIG